MTVSLAKGANCVRNACLAAMLGMRNRCRLRPHRCFYARVCGDCAQVLRYDDGFDCASARPCVDRRVMTFTLGTFDWTRAFKRTTFAAATFAAVTITIATPAITGRRQAV